MTSTYIAYKQYLDQYRKEYGHQTIILYQVGNFYEIYSADDAYFNLKEITDVLNIMMTRKNKSKPLSENNPNLAGIPVHASAKYIRILLNNGYTIVQVGHCEKNDEGAKTLGSASPRRVEEIYSPGTRIDVAPNECNYLLVAYIEEYPANPKYKINSGESKKKVNGTKSTSPVNGTKSTSPLLRSIGISLIDISTGKTYVAECGDTLDDKELAFDDFYYFINMYSIKEIVLISVEPLLMSYKDIISRLSITHIYTHNLLGTLSTEFLKCPYQQQCLKKVYTDYGLLTPHEYLNLETMPFASISFVYMLDFCYRHNSQLLNNLPSPTILYKKLEHCNIAYNAAKQLEMSHLCQILNKCKTAIGRRHFNYRMYRPLISSEDITDRYELVEYFISIYTNPILHKKFISYMENIYDIERLSRSISMNKLTPIGIANLLDTALSIRKICKLLSEYQFSEVKDVRKLCKYIESQINISKIKMATTTHIEKDNDDDADDNIATSYNIQTHIFNTGVNAKLDTFTNDIIGLSKLFEQLAISLQPSNESKSGFYKIEYNDKNGYTLSLTKTKYKKIQTATYSKQIPAFIKLEYNPLISTTSNKSTYIIKPNKFIYKSNNSGNIYTLNCDELDELNSKISMARQLLNREIEAEYMRFINGLKEYLKLFSNMTEYIAEIDWFYSCAKTAVDYKYYRPNIYDSKNNASFINADEVRHPIIERILTDEPYIHNSIQLGFYLNDIDDTNYMDNLNNTYQFDVPPPYHEHNKINNATTENATTENATYGMLLYGVNSSGKSSLSKAIALVIIMAQCGMYVPAKLSYYPYHDIFTRIPSGDNIIKGQSTFIVEISELSNILRRANKNSLVIGDEVASGTEHISALSIVGAGINKLCELGATFIFATHLHELPNISAVYKLIEAGHIGVYHMHVEFDAAHDCLIYHRDLRKGSGTSLYGLEVCKSFIADKSFIHISTEIQNELLKKNNLCKQKKSSYNKNLYVDICMSCGKAANEVHHIELQKYADINGFIGNKHKNSRHNLMAICDYCHDNIHSGKIHINGYKRTTKGIRLNIITA
jgi:DNA mismatch repair protein MutS